MNKAGCRDELLENYEAFYLMTRSAALCGTQNAEAFDRDMQVLIGFLGQVYGWRRELAEAAEEMILSSMMRIGLISDYYALASADLLEEELGDLLIFYEIKGKALEEVNLIETLCAGRSGDKAAQEVRNSLSLRFFHHVYDPRVRYAHFEAGASRGEPVSTLQTALMLLLGIGCEKNIARAQRLLERALLWGEKAAAKILGFLWEQEGDREQASFYQIVFAYLSAEAGPPAPLPAEAAESAAEYCSLLSAVRSAVIRNSGRYEIDALFADLINREDIPFSEKLAWIYRYRECGWLKSCLRDPPAAEIGFLRGERRQKT